MALALIISQEAAFVSLACKFGHHVQTYPTVLFINASGELLGKTGYVHGGAQIWVDSAKHLVQHSVNEDPELLAQIQTNN